MVYGKNYGKNYGTMLKTIKLRFTKEENMVDYPKLRNFDLLWEKWYYPKTIKDFEQIYSFRWKKYGTMGQEAHGLHRSHEKTLEKKT